jgi:preprotein translocase subunit YajC
MGIIGIVDKIQQDTIILKMIDGTRIEFLTGAITDVSSVPEEESKE